MVVVVCLYVLSVESRLKRKFRGCYFFLGDVRSGVGLFWTGFVVVFGGRSVGVCELFSVMGGFGCFFLVCLVLFLVVGVYVVLVEIVP